MFLSLFLCFLSFSFFLARPGGQSIGLNAQRALQGLGLFEEFKKKATIVPHGDWFQWRTGEGNEQRLICTVGCQSFLASQPMLARR